jgi:hypothetical protein
VVKASKNGSMAVVEVEEQDVDESDAPKLKDVREVRVTLRGTAPYSPSRAIQSEKGDKEDHDEFDKRCWRERAHSDAEGFVCIPGNALYLALLDAASYRGEKFKGMKTWFSLFERGVSIFDPMFRIEPEVKMTDVEMVKLYLPSDGTPAYKAKGSSKRVWRRFPVVNEWSVEARFYLFDGRIGEDVFRRHLSDAGTFIGLGRWRPACRGTNGRFVIEDLTVREANL